MKGKEDGAPTAHAWNYNEMKRSGRKYYLLVNCMSGCYILNEKNFYFPKI
jgi:hypothetical protein